jgi:hypothetical protein
MRMYSPQRISARERSARVLIAAGRLPCHCAAWIDVTCSADVCAGMPGHACGRYAQFRFFERDPAARFLVKVSHNATDYLLSPVIAAIFFVAGRGELDYGYRDDAATFFVIPLAIIYTDAIFGVAHLATHRLPVRTWRAAHAQGSPLVFAFVTRLPCAPLCSRCGRGIACTTSTAART